MPTPPNGSISIGSLEKEFGVVEGSPSGIGEYTGRTGSFSGTSLGIQGVSTKGQVAFSDLRNRTAHASPELIIDTLFESFRTKYRQEYVKIADGRQISGSYTIDPVYSAYFERLGQKYTKFITGTTLPWKDIGSGFTFTFTDVDNPKISYDSIIEYAGTWIYRYGLAALNSTTNGNIPNASYSSPYVQFRTGIIKKVAGLNNDIRIPNPWINENIHNSLNNTIVYLATGKCKHIGDYGTGTNGNTPVTSRLRIGGFRFNGRPVSPQDESVALTWGVDHGIGAGGGKYNSFGRTVKTCMAVYNTGSVNFTNCESAQFDAGGAFWNGNLGSKDSDTLYQKFIMLIPNRWERVSSTLYPLNTGQMTLQPGDIAIVTNASNTGYSVEASTVGYKRGWGFRQYSRGFFQGSYWDIPRGARIIPEAEMKSYYGNLLTVDAFPPEFRTKQVYEGRRWKTVPVTSVDEAFALSKDKAVYYEEGISQKIPHQKMFWAPILNRTAKTDRFLPALFFSSTSMFGNTAIGVYANYFNTTITCDLSTKGFAPYVSIFRFVGDGYMTSRRGITYPDSNQTGIPG